MMPYIVPIASGSGGNAVLFVSEKARILIDAGTNTKTIRGAMSAAGFELSDLTHILITHAHNDHVSALPVLMKHTRAKLCVSRQAVGELKEGLCDLASGFEYFDRWEALDTCVKSFPTSHDSYGSVGFVLESGGKSLAYCTDLGKITNHVRQAVGGVDTLYIESNHDVDMLKRGPYPWSLKQRILSENGHISNVECADFAVKCCEMGAKNIILAHLSEENNSPEKALLEMESALYKSGAGQDIKVRVAQKRNTQPPIVV